ncbi:MAG: DNA-binding transcriptional regulator [Acidobacteriia bacterium]|nr:DNA-binding transcriptional regulator [Terriglobia bacterium]
MQETMRWNVYIEENTLKDQRLPDLRSWKGDGIIADFDHPKVAAAVVQSKLPAVGFGSGYGWYVPGSQIPYFFANNDAIAALAADHLLSRGLRQFAYCGFPQNPINGWSEERERTFMASVARRGFSCSIYHGRHQTSQRWASVQLSLGKWLQSLPKPVGLMAANDNRGRQVLEACRACGLRVPEDVAVIGVDNDELLCKLSSPLLSSVEQGAKRLGYEAAALLDKIMPGKKASITRFIIDPVEVVTRGSTEILAIDEPKVAEAVAYISGHFSNRIKVQDVLDAVAVSRSGLENRFKKTLGYSVRTAIRRFQLEQTRRLVSETNLPLKQIASDAGFRSVQHMTTLFGKAFKQSPAKYRLVRASR